MHKGSLGFSVSTSQPFLQYGATVPTVKQCGKPLIFCSLVIYNLPTMLHLLFKFQLSVNVIVAVRRVNVLEHSCGWREALGGRSWK